MNDKHSTGTKQLFVNLTPHEVNIGDFDFPASGTVARVVVEHHEIGNHAGIPLLVGSYGEVSNLPCTEEIVCGSFGLQLIPLSNG